MSCSPQNPSPTSPLSPSWPMFSAPSSPMPTSSTSSDSSPIRSVAEFALLFIAFAIFCLIYSVSPTSLFPLHPAPTPAMQLSALGKRGAFKRLPPPGDPLNPPLSLLAGARWPLWWSHSPCSVSLVVSVVLPSHFSCLQFALLPSAAGKTCTALTGAGRDNKPLENAAIPHFLAASLFLSGT